MQKKWMLWMLLALFIGCENPEYKPCNEVEKTQQVTFPTEIIGFSSTSLPGISTQIQKISALLFSNSTQLFYKEINFDVIDTSYTLQIPVGVWDLVLLGSGDNNLPTFATPPIAYVTHLTDPMVAPPYVTGTGYGNLREYFYAHQVCTVTAATTTLPKMTLKRIVSKLNLQTSTTLADSLSRVQITLDNVIASVNFLGVPSTTYVNQTINQLSTDKINGAYSFTFYTLGSKPLGSNPATNFLIDMLYVRKSLPANTYHFYMYSPTDFQAGGMVVNTSTTVNLGI